MAETCNFFTVSVASGKKVVLSLLKTDRICCLKVGKDFVARFLTKDDMKDFVTAYDVTAYDLVTQDPEDLRSLTKWNSNELVANHHHQPQNHHSQSFPWN